MIWKRPFTIESLNAFSQNTMNEHLDLKFTAFGPDFLQATMPVDHRTMQPYRLLHGGASASLAESVGSCAAILCLSEDSGMVAVGQELNISHLSSARGGLVTATAKPFRIGRSAQVWGIEIVDEAGRLVSVARLTMAVIAQNK